MNAGAKTALQYAREIESGLENDTVEMPFLKRHADAAVNSALKKATKALRKKGAHGFAQEIEFEWAAYYGESLFTSQRDIGDHAPIIKKLDEWYMRLEAILGFDLMKNLHLIEIKGINSGVPVSIKPCTYPMDGISEDQRLGEYLKHLGGGNPAGDIYFGALPSISFYAAEIGCLAAGGAIICSPIAGLTEKLVALASPFIGTKIFNRFCGGL